MSDEDVAWAIAALEREFEWQDAEFRRHFQRLQRHGAVNAAVVAVLLGLAALLFALGLTATSLILWILGGGTLGLSLGVNECYQWRLRRAH